MTKNEYRNCIENYLKEKELLLNSLAKHDPILENQVKFYMFTKIFAHEHNKAKAYELNDALWIDFINGIRN